MRQIGGAMPALTSSSRPACFRSFPCATASHFSSSSTFSSAIDDDRYEIWDAIRKKLGAAPRADVGREIV